MYSIFVLYDYVTVTDSACAAARLVRGCFLWDLLISVDDASNGIIGEAEFFGEFTHGLALVILIANRLIAFAVIFAGSAFFAPFLRGNCVGNIDQIATDMFLNFTN